MKLTKFKSWEGNPDRSRTFFGKIPGLKFQANPVPKNPGIPGFCKIPSQKSRDWKFLIPLEPGQDRQNFAFVLMFQVGEPSLPFSSKDDIFDILYTLFCHKTDYVAYW